jgi:hypothetical protein
MTGREKMPNLQIMLSAAFCRCIKKTMKRSQRIKHAYETKKVENANSDLEEPTCPLCISSIY